MQAEAPKNDIREPSDAGATPMRALATLNAADFKKLQTILTGFQKWNDFDDFCMERDGELLSIACGGFEAELVCVSLAAFEDWRAHNQAPATLESLDQFAGLMAAFRKTPWADVAASAPTPVAYTHTTLIVTVSLSRYQDWARAFERSAAFAEVPDLDDFARLLLELWADGVPPEPAARSNAAPA